MKTLTQRLVANLFASGPRGRARRSQLRRDAMPRHAVRRAARAGCEPLESRILMYSLGRTHFVSGSIGWTVPDPVNHPLTVALHIQAGFNADWGSNVNP